MHQSLRLGMIAPSSNTVLEPMTAALLADAPWITAHSARIRVTSISMGSGSLAQFDAEPMLEAARLLAEARVRSEEHTSELQSLMRISYAVFCLKKKNR